MTRMARSPSKFVKMGCRTPFLSGVARATPSKESVPDQLSHSLEAPYTTRILAEDGLRGLPINLKKNIHLWRSNIQLIDSIQITGKG